MSIQGKVALVTGAGQGIGRAIATRLAKDGAHVAIVDLNEDKMNDVAAEVRKLGRKATTFRADVSKRDDVYAAIDHAEKELGGFDVMVNNAGIAQVLALTEVTPEDLDKVLKINVAGVLWESRPRRRNSSSASRRERSSPPLPLPAMKATRCSVSIARASSPCVRSPRPRPRNTRAMASR